MATKFPRPLQKDVLPLVWSGNVRLLAWEPGVGKTAVPLLAGAFEDKPSLYLAPPSIVWQVEQEAKAFIGDDYRTQVLDNGRAYVDPAADLVICSYGLITQPWMWKQLFGRRWGLMTLDEAHLLKSRDAKRTKAVYGARTSSKGALFRSADRVLAMTGTPVLNDPSDLWTHYSRLFPEAVVDEEDGKPLPFNRWVDRYCLIRHGDFGDKIIGGRNLDELRERLAPFWDRRTREGLPPLTIDTVVLRGEQLRLTGLPDEVIKTVTKVTQLVEQDEDIGDFEPALATLRARIALAKADKTAELVAEMIRGGVAKLILFGIHREALDRMEASLRAAGVGAVQINGDVSGLRRHTLIEHWKQPDGPAVLVGQLHAMGTGLNLQEASHVVFAEAAWTPAVNEQGIARAHRSGQENPVLVQFIALKNSVDEAVMAALARKAKMIAKIL
jgi:SWI/SNF-related matrix-associated actin-dependent regulator 1 of chromatin subfamily A